MPERPEPLATPGDIAAALALLTRLPLPVAVPSRGARAAWAWPVAGLVVGVVAALAALAGHGLGLPPAVSAGLTLSAAIAVTGALHEDGLADSADGFWGGWSRQRRLEIMRDSRIGSYGVLALVFAIGLQAASLAGLRGFDGVLVLVAAHALSRLAIVEAAVRLPYLRPEGLGAFLAAGVPYAARREARWSGVAAALVLVLVDAPAALLALFLAWLAQSATVSSLRRRLGGTTGDGLGAVQQLTFTALLLGMSAA